ncbi:zinc dependent phospholipase C family protein [Candidatus Leptofilum sp.]|uniref:zinc dependent phospholipase C family protein n=1 Tax=Candidatus Leptofilum sp. TaxID=3241576 RepID=UPI003B5B6E7B
MPTPFMHLHTAEQILDMVSANGNGRLHQTLSAEWPAFYLGSVAPDVNAISPLPRVSTHFYDVPPQPEETAYGTMLTQYPQLVDFGTMSAGQAICVAAYSAHLMLDLIWLREIVYPFFYKADHLGDRKQRQLTHFILLTYLDTIAFDALPETAVSTLAAAQPKHWLPFVDDSILIAWQEMLTEQLAPGAAIRTIEIYAGRLKMSPAQFAANLKDPDWMKAQVFDKIPVDIVQQILQAAVPRSIDLIQNYLP